MQETCQGPGTIGLKAISLLTIHRSSEIPLRIPASSKIQHGVHVLSLLLYNLILKTRKKIQSWCLLHVNFQITPSTKYLPDDAVHGIKPDATWLNLSSQSLGSEQGRAGCVVCCAVLGGRAKLIEGYPFYKGRLARPAFTR